MLCCVETSYIFTFLMTAFHLRLERLVSGFVLFTETGSGTKVLMTHKHTAACIYCSHP